MSIDLVWPFLLIGLASGGLYTLLGCGVVLAYRASGYLHIAHAGVAMVCALVYVLVARDAPVGVALLVALGLGGLVATVLYRVVFVRLESASMAAKVVVSVATGVGLQAVGGVLLINFGLLDGGPRGSGPLFPESTRFTIFGASATGQQLALPVIALLVVGALQLVLHRTDFGLALRASSQNPLSASLAGLPSRRITTTAWAATGVLAGLAGVLSVSATSFLIPTYLFAETIRGLASALTGGFVDLKRTALAAFALGILEQELVGFSPPWNAMRGALSFALITLVAVFGLSRGLGQSERAGAMT
jgi:branched-chain amino acid transport system permease protein